MGRDGRSFIEVVLGPDGRPARIVEPPPANLKRWSARRKAEVVASVRGGMLSLEDACDRYALTVEEFVSWESAIHDYGLAGLRMSEIQNHRHAH